MRRALLAMVVTWAWATPALAANLGTLTPVGRDGVAYRWSKDGNSIDLCDRGAAWTEEHATWVRDALDPLPALFVRKAIAGGLKRIHRDRVPTGAFGVAMTGFAGVAVPVWPWNFVSLGDPTFGWPDGCKAVVVHELGHCVHAGLPGASLLPTPGFTDISWVPITAGYGLQRWSGFVSDYARTNHREDFAECCETYWHSPDALAAANPRKFAYMRDVVFEGATSPPAVRLNWTEHVEVLPVIDRLGDASDTVGSHVAIHGQRFMAPYDGGFNAVRFRGTRTLHLPVSRRTLHAWVPPIGAGSAPVTVTTQDGRSNEAAFGVKKPWWQFW